jgi:hypothetical protein
MNNKLNNIFSETDCLSPEILLAYAENRLNASDRYLVEKHLTDCELCSEALEGLSQVKDRSNLSKIFAGINKEIDKRTQKKDAKVFRFDFRMRLAAAAILITVVGITVLFRYYLTDTKKEMLAQRTVKETEIPKEGMKSKPSLKDKEAEQTVAASEKTSDGKNKKSLMEGTKMNMASDGESNMAYGSANATSGNQAQPDFQQQAYLGFYKAEEQENSKKTAEDMSLLEKNEADKGDNLNTNTIIKAEMDADKVMADSISAYGGNVAETKSVSQTEEITAYRNETSKDQTKSKNKANKKYTVTDERAPAVTTVTGAVSDQRYDDGIQKYSNSDYSGSIGLLGSYIEDYPKDYNALYYCGASYYFLNQYDNAITYFDKVLKYKEGSYYEIAQWYLALSYIAKDEKKKAEKILDDIVKSEGSFKTQAEEKLLEIKGN